MGQNHFMDLAHEGIFLWLSQFAYQPMMVYCLIVLMMTLSAFGLPIPEEVTLLSAGFLAHMGAHPELYPPPYAGAPVVDPVVAALVSTVSVFCTDLLIYGIGRKWGRKLIVHPWMARFFSPQLLERAESFTSRYGMLATGIFRFTPGIRFPGHLLCGILKFSVWKFMLVDGIAVMISVPTQVLLIAHYGDHILGALRQFKTFVFAALGIALVAFIAVKLKQRFQKKNRLAEAVAVESIANEQDSRSARPLDQ